MAEAIDHVRRMRSRGLAGDEPVITRDELIRFKRSFTAPVPAMKQKSFAENGIDTHHGRAMFCGPRSVEVEGQVLEGRFVLIAVGAVPTRLGIAGEEHVVTSTDFLELERLPKRIVVLGGGFIAAEFANIAARAGAQVTVIEQSDRMLAPFDPDLVGWLMEKFHEIGIDVRLHTRVTAIEKSGDGLTIRAQTNGKNELFEADLAVHAAGRVPDLEPLHMALAGVTTAKGRLELNEFLQSVSNPAVYAVGDAASSGPPPTPVSSHDARIAAANMLDGNRERPSYLDVPSVAFTTPPIASVGMSEQQVRHSGLKFRIKSEKASSWYAARNVAETTYGGKLLVDESNDRILDAHLIGPHCDEVINIFGLAIRKGLTTEDWETMMFAYPTATSDICYMLSTL